MSSTSGSSTGRPRTTAKRSSARRPCSWRGSIWSSRVGAGFRATSSWTRRSSRSRGPPKGRGTPARLGDRRAGDELRGLRLAPRGRVLVQRAAGGRSVEHPHELGVLGRHLLAIAVLDGGLEALRERLDRRSVAQVLEPLTGGRPDALLLLLDVRHLEKTPASRCGRA